MQVKLINATEKEFKNDKGELIRGWSLLFLNQKDNQTHRYFVDLSNLKGFDPKQVCDVKGPDLEISTDAATFNGITRVKLSSIRVLGK